jgi:hypothetical protein
MVPTTTINKITPQNKNEVNTENIPPETAAMSKPIPKLKILLFYSLAKF